MLCARAPAKINLSLRVHGRRPDGYHELESLVAFAGVADRLTFEPGPSLTLHVEGPTAGSAGDPCDNLVVKAARELARRMPGVQLGAFTLTKQLPVAAGLGGGSADAAAALRLIAENSLLKLDHPDVRAAAADTGADVPVCLDSQARMMHGIGERLGPSLKLPRLFAVLVNPRAALATAAVFRSLSAPALSSDASTAYATPPLEKSALMAWLVQNGNDLEAPALSLCPAIETIGNALRALPGCRLARMSGSGATVYGLFDNCRDAASAARRLKADQPTWWIKPTVLR